MATLSEYRELGRQVSNWGRWGAEDQLGTLNFIDDDAVREAAVSVTTGQVFPLGVAFDATLRWGTEGLRRNPVHVMTVDGGDARNLASYLPQLGPGAEATFTATWASPLRYADDMIIMSLQCATQWDALSHAWYDGQLYNGVPEAAVTSLGAARNGIENAVRKGIAARAVLLDVARFRGVPHIPENEGILPAELDAVVEHQSLTVKRGDIVLVRTGWLPQLPIQQDGDRWRMRSPGLNWQCAEWLSEREVAAVAADNVAVEAFEPSVDGMVLPLHGLCLRDMGLMLGELWNLESLAEACRADGNYAFQLVAPPLCIPGAVGSPVNPIAVK